MQNMLLFSDPQTLLLFFLDPTSWTSSIHQGSKDSRDQSSFKLDARLHMLLVLFQQTWHDQQPAHKQQTAEEYSMVKRHIL